MDLEARGVEAVRSAVKAMAGREADTVMMGLAAEFHETPTAAPMRARPTC